MLIYDEQTGQYVDSEKVEAIISAFVLAYAPKKVIFDAVVVALEDW